MPVEAPSFRELSGMVRRHRTFARKHDELIQALLTKHQLRPNSQPKNWHALFFPASVRNDVTPMYLQNLLKEACTLEQWMSFQRSNSDLFKFVKDSVGILDVVDDISIRLAKLDMPIDSKNAKKIEYVVTNEYVVLTPFLYELEERLANFLSISKEELDSVFRH